MATSIDLTTTPTMKECIYSALWFETLTFENLVNEYADWQSGEEDVREQLCILEEDLGVAVVTIELHNGMEVMRIIDPQPTLRQFLEARFL